MLYLSICFEIAQGLMYWHCVTEEKVKKDFLKTKQNTTTENDMHNVLQHAHVALMLRW